jgi:hypothetical protein
MGVAWEGLSTRVGLGIFLIDIRVLCNDHVHSDDWDGMYLFAGPHTILRCYEDATTTHLPT